VESPRDVRDIAETAVERDVDDLPGRIGQSRGGVAQPRPQETY
jgi:hypothetical protein